METMAARLATLFLTRASSFKVFPRAYLRKGGREGGKEEKEGCKRVKNKRDACPQYVKDIEVRRRKSRRHHTSLPNHLSIHLSLSAFLLPPKHLPDNITSPHVATCAVVLKELNALGIKGTRGTSQSAWKEGEGKEGGGTKPVAVD